jgi:hypothetical protein
MAAGSRNSDDHQSFSLDTVGNCTTHIRARQSWSYTLDCASNRIASVSGA